MNNKSRLATAAPGDHFNAAWAADGRSFFFSSNRKGIKNIYRQWLDGFSSEEEILVTGRDKNVESSSPDGRYLVFNQYDHRNPMTLWVLPLDQRDRKPLLVGPGASGIHCAKRKVDCLLIDSGVTVTSVPGSNVGAGTWRLGEGGDPQWSEDGKELFFLRGGDFMSIPVGRWVTVEFGLPRRLFTATPGPSPRNHYTFSANGDRFVFDTPMVRSRADVLVLLTNWAK